MPAGLGLPFGPVQKSSLGPFILILPRSDSNAYFPVGPCEYGGPIQALQNGDANAGEPFPHNGFHQFLLLSVFTGRTGENSSPQHL